MSGEVRILIDRGGVLGQIVDGLHVLVAQLEGTPHALVGGVAVLVRVQGHRVTHDIDSAVRSPEAEVQRRLTAVASPAPKRDATVVLDNGVPVDVLYASARPPRKGIGAFREARGHAIRWAIETAEPITVDTEPSSSRGPITLPVARASALVALKTVAIADPRRGDKRATDLLDVWRLLADDPILTGQHIEELVDAPPALRSWVGEQLQRLFATDPGGFMSDMAPGPGAPDSISEVRDLWGAVLEPGLRL